MPEPLGVFVLGMHRSGTSATTRLVNLLGVPVGEQLLLAPGNQKNPDGFWEVLPLTALNDRLLAELGGAWGKPPSLETLVAARRLLRGRAANAARLFRAAHSGPQWAWKDPRTCLTLGFWRSALDQKAVAVFAYRDPVEVAASLRGHGLQPAFGLALWEHYLHAALLLSRGMPSLVVDYRETVSDPAAAADRVGRFLEAHGAELAPGGAERAARSVRPELWRRRANGDAGAARRLLSPQQARLAAQLRGAVAAGAGLDAVDPGLRTVAWR